MPALTIECFANNDEFLAALARRHADEIAGIVWELSPAFPSWPELVPTGVTDIAATRPILVLARTSPQAIRAINQLAMKTTDLRISLWRPQEFEAELNGLVAAEPEPSAVQPLLRHLVSAVPDRLRSIVAVAAMASTRRTSVGEFAELCQQSEEAVRDRLQEASSLTPRDLLGLLTSLHAAWRRGVLNKSCKWTANRAGCATAALDHYVRRHARLSLRSLANTEAFNALLEQLLSALHNRGRRALQGERLLTVESQPDWIAQSTMNRL